MGDIYLIKFIFAWSNQSFKAFSKTGKLFSSPFNGYLVTGTVIKYFTNVQNVGLAMYQQYILPISILAPYKTTILQWIRITLSYIIIGFPMCRRVHKDLDIDFRSCLKTRSFVFSVFFKLPSTVIRSYGQCLNDLVVHRHIFYLHRALNICIWSIWGGF